MNASSSVSTDDEPSSSSLSSVDLSQELYANLEKALRESGIEEPDDELLDAIVAAAEAASLILCARELRRMLAKLGKNPGAEAIGRLMLDDNTPIKSVAKRLKCSPNAIRKAQASLRRFLGLPKELVPPHQLRSEENV
jgi:hypothetical protein